MIYLKNRMIDCRKNVKNNKNYKKICEKINSL